MRRFIFLTSLGLTCFAFSSKAQKFKDSLCNCSVMINTKSYFWKKDSLADNGYRLCAADELIRCKLDTITSKYLIDNFGKPNKKQKTNQGIEYIYFYYDYRKLPKELKAFGVVYYVSFHFKNENSIVTEITDGHFD